MMLAPSEMYLQMHAVLNHVAKQKKFILPEDIAESIITDSNGNMRKALLIFEALKMQNPSWNTSGASTSKVDVAKPDWETYCHKVADLIVEQQTPARVMEVRGKFYELLSHCIPATVILKTVAERVVEKVDDAIRADIMHWAAIYVRTCTGT